MQWLALAINIQNDEINYLKRQEMTDIIQRDT